MRCLGVNWIPFITCHYTHKHSTHTLMNTARLIISKKANVGIMRSYPSKLFRLNTNPSIAGYILIRFYNHYLPFLFSIYFVVCFIPFHSTFLFLPLSLNGPQSPIEQSSFRLLPFWYLLQVSIGKSIVPNSTLISLLMLQHNRPLTQNSPSVDKLCPTKHISKR